ncbi:MAG: hypothetical protein ABR923_19415 [Terracidiphilus sp.]|jgi:hypothetical protein
MNKSRVLALTAALSVCFAVVACYHPRPAYASGQVAVDVGVAPDCPYGYYDVPPYDCAPYGYYGPEWFTGGVFIGAGPWFHGPAGFHGHVNNRFDVQHGYTGPRPNRGDKAEPGKDINHIQHFKGNEVRDGRGHVGKH